MAKAILSVEEFFQKLSVQQKFWHMRNGVKSRSIEGPCTVKQLGEETISYTVKENGKIIEKKAHIGDLVNRFHGVFLTEESAKQYLVDYIPSEEEEAIDLSLLIE